MFCMDMLEKMAVQNFESADQWMWGVLRDLKISVQLTFGSHIDRLNANV